MKKIYLILILFPIVLSTSAQFNGYFDPSNWSVKKSAGSNGQVIFDGAPDFVVISGSDNGTGPDKNTDLIIALNMAGRIRFSWDYHTNNSNEDPSFDVALVGISGSYTQLTSNTGGIDQSGDYSSPILPAGTQFSLRVKSLDNARGYATLNVYNFSFTNVVLPVKLESFTSEVEENFATLHWKIAGAENFSHFELEHADESMNFHKIQTIPFRSTEPYSFKHANPLPGLNLYRLKMVDKDGSYTFSNTLPVKMADVMAVASYPNPASSQLNLELTSSITGKETIYLSNQAGQIVSQQSFLIRKGSNKVQINTSTLLPGYYTLKISSTGHTRKLLKQ